MSVERPNDEVTQEQEVTDACPGCGSIDTDLGHEEYDDGPGELPEQVEFFICANCEHEWELDA